MDFDLTDEQILFKDSAARLVAEHSSAAAASPRPDAGSALAAHGFLALGLPGAHGGIGGPAEIAIVCREFGRGPLAIPYVGAFVLPSQLVIAAGSAAQQAELLPSVATGERRLAAALDEPTGPGGSPPTTVRRDGARFRLSGRKCLVIGGQNADRLIVSAKIDGKEDALFFVDPHLDGVRMATTPLVDGTMAEELWLDQVEVGAEDRLSGAAPADASVTRARRYAILGAGALITGAMERALEVTSDYINTRKQFGAKLASFQVLRHRVADMAIDCAMAEAAVFKLIASFQAPDVHDPDLAAATCKLLTSDLGQRVCSQAIQLHGGMGLAEECGIGRYYALVIANRALLGTPPAHLAAYIERLGAQLRGESGREPARAA